MTKRTAPSDVNCLVVISDSHCGCKLGLCPADQEIQLDDGGTYKASPVQGYIWHHWRKFWDEFVPAETKGEPYAVVHNGDAVDGVPHKATTPISHNLQDQENIAAACLEPIVELCQGRYYQVRGTEAHVAKSGASEESLARRLGAVKNREGQSATWELWKRVGPCIAHFSHHIGTTQSAHHESAAVNAEISKMLVDAARFQQQIPDIAVRSHRHQYTEVILPAHRQEWGPGANQHRIRSIVTPAWQAKTPFAYKVARGRPPQFGGVVIRWSGKELYTVAYVATFTNVEIR